MSTLGGPNIVREDLLVLIDVANQSNIIDNSIKNSVNYQSIFNINGNINLEGLFLLVNNENSVTGDIIGLGNNITISLLFKTEQLNSIKIKTNKVLNLINILESYDVTQLTLTISNQENKIIQKLYLNSNLLLDSEISIINPISLINKVLINNLGQEITKFSYLMIYNKVLSEFEIERNFLALLRR